jgi:hypothetical protein
MLMMYGSYRVFRYGEQYEYRSGPKLAEFGVPLQTLAQVKDIEAWVSKLS